MAASVRCTQCGEVGGNEFAYDGVAVRLHAHYEGQWIAGYEATNPTTRH